MSRATGARARTRVPRAECRRAALVARVELRHRWRAIRGDARRQGALAVAGLFTFLPVAGGSAAAYSLGSALAGGTLPIPIEALRGVAAGVFAFVAVFVALRAVQHTATPPISDLLLSAASHHSVVAGVVLAEAIGTVGVVAVGACCVAIAFALGSGSLLGGVSIVTALCALAVLGVLAGFAAGLAIRNVLARSPVLSRYRAAIGVGAFLAYLVVVTTGSFANALGPVVTTLGATPLGWFADLALVPFAPVDRVAAVAAVGSFAVGTAGLAWSCSVLAARLWYIGPVGHADGDSGIGIAVGVGGHGETGRGMVTGGAIAGGAVADGPSAEGEGDSRPAIGDPRAIGRRLGVSRPVLAVARRGWLRAKRAPIRLLYVTYPLFLGVDPASAVVRTGQVPETLPPVLALYGAWATGAAFSLNPIGDEGPVLPVTLTTAVSGTEFVGGSCLAGLAVCLPITVLITAFVGVASPLSPALVGLAVATALVLSVAATGIAAGFGALFPRTETARITRGREAIVPSIAAFGLYSISLVVAAAPVLLATATPTVRNTLVDASGRSVGVLAVGGFVLTATLALACGAICFRYAVREFETYRLE